MFALFFVISGFLITHLLMVERERTGTIDLRRFYLRRTIRIFPPYYALLFSLLILDATALIPPQPLSALVRAFTYTSNYAGPMTWQIGHTWSLSVEEQFYLLWPVALALGIVQRAWRWPALALLLCPLLRLVEFHSVHRQWVGRSFETTADALACGCLLALLAPRLRESPLYQWLLSRSGFVLVPVIALLSFAQGEHPHVSLLVCDTLANTGIALCVHWAVVHSDGPVGRVLNVRPVMALCKISYSLYLWQEIFLNRYASAPINVFH